MFYLVSDFHVSLHSWFVLCCLYSFSFVQLHLLLSLSYYETDLLDLIFPLQHRATSFALTLSVWLCYSNILYSLYQVWVLLLYLLWDVLDYLFSMPIIHQVFIAGDSLRSIPAYIYLCLCEEPSLASVPQIILYYQLASVNTFVAYICEHHWLFFIYFVGLGDDLSLEAVGGKGLEKGTL